MDYEDYEEQEDESYHEEPQELDLNYLYDKFGQMKSYCEHKGLDLLNSKDAYLNFVLLSNR